MEKLQGPINPCLIAEELEVGNWLDEFISSTTKFEDSYNTEEGGCYYYGESPHYTLPSLEDKMPFLQMLQTVESSHHHHHHHHHQHHQHQHQQHHQHHQQSSFPLMQFEPNFQFLLKLQHPKLTCFSSTTTTTLDDHHLINHTHMISNINDNNVINNGVKSETRSKTSNNINNNNNNNDNDNDNDVVKKEGSVEIKGGVKEKRKRKRTTTRVVKNKEEVENQRMTHIAVERNRRRQMNEHLSALRSLMPPSYAQRGDQASIIGGAIDFVKELEQMLQSLQAQKKMRQSEEKVDVSRTTSTTTTTTTSSSSNMFMDSSFPFHESRNPIPSHEEGNGKGNGNGNENENGIVLEGNGVRKSCNEEFSAEKKSALADIEVVVIQNHVNLKIQCQRRPGQLLKAIVAFEELRLTVLHLNITSLHSLVHYSFNLKIEDDCKLGSADDVARAVHQIFSFINLN